MKKQKGITLVALVITIIVMLILAGVTISIVINANIFNQAEKATTSTMQANYDDTISISISDGYTWYYGFKVNGTNKTALEVATEIGDRINERFGVATGNATKGAVAAQVVANTEAKVTVNYPGFSEKVLNVKLTALGGTIEIK